MSVFDTTGLEAFIRENNPKFANQKILELKAWAKDNGLDKSYDPYKAAYGSTPTHAAADAVIKKQYLKRHFCYAYKAGTLTNGLGILRAIEFYDKDYFASHPEIERYKKINVPELSVERTNGNLPTKSAYLSSAPRITSKTVSVSENA